MKRNERALRAIRNLRFRQKCYTQKIDILCHDIVGAHTEFVDKLSILTFSLRFQESLLGAVDLCGILDSTALFLRQNLHGAGSAIFLIEPKGFDIHFAGAAEQFSIEKGQFEKWFTPQMVYEISHSRQVCSLEQMLAMGLQAPPAALKHLAAVAIPLNQIGRAMGFVLLYRPADNPFTPQELTQAAATVPAIRIAIERIQNTAESRIGTSI
jgi:GAF domain-containing protein